MQRYRTWNDTYTLTVTAGTSFTKTKGRSTGLIGWGDSKYEVIDGKPTGNAYYPNIFMPSNYYRMTTSLSLKDKRLNSVFGTAQFGYKDGFFVDVTARNDWSSALAFTESMSFFYPSVGASILLDKFIDLGKNINMLKLRASYSIVGNDVPVFMSNLRYTLKDGGAKVILKKGGEYGDLYVRQLQRDADGKPVVDNSAPKLSGDGINDMKYVGNMNAKVNMGWSNTFTYKNFALSFLVDGKFGGKVLSMTEATLDGWGVSERSGAARDAGTVTVDGSTFDATKFYRATGATNFNSQYANEMYVYDATNVRLRELSLGYTFRNLLGYGKNLTASLIGRNLLFFYKDAPMDPDVSVGTKNGWQGVDLFSLPSSRSFGLNLKLNF